MNFGIERRINAAIGATMDRRFITKRAKKESTLKGIDLQYYNDLKKVSGPSVHNPVKVAKNWIKAYNHNITRLKNVEAWNAPFKKQSQVAQIAKTILSKIIKSFKRV